jgi:hypothetical protein
MTASSAVTGANSYRCAMRGGGRSIAKISTVDATLAAHLGQHVHTGYVCRYDDR